MKVIFLDVDGVLNHANSEGNGEPANLDHEKFILLKEIVDKTDAKIVLSSTWRFTYEENGKNMHAPMYYKLIELLKKYDLDLYAETPEIKSKEIIKSITFKEILEMPTENVYTNRAHAVKTWLDEHPEVKSFVIIDDEEAGWDYFNLDKNYIQTSYTGGLLPEHVTQAIEILNKTKVKKR